MLCGKPYFGIGILPFGCGQCLGCRINRSRLWAHRIELESFLHNESCFLTLTYDDKNLPVGGSLEPSHPQEWLKRLRQRIAPGKVRYYLAGEYGSVLERPHYHVVLFGFQSCAFGRSRYRLGIRNCCSSCDLVRDTWGKGFVELGELNSKTAQYVCKYVTKVNTIDQEAFLNGRHKEFSRMSLRPGIGARAMLKVRDSFRGSFGSSYLRLYGDVPSALVHGKKQRPLGRYLMCKLRECVGIVDGKKPDEAGKAYSLEVQKLLKENVSLTENVSKPWNKIVLDLYGQKRLNAYKRFYLHT